MLLLILALRRIREPERRAAALALVSFPVLWVGVYAFETAYFKPNNMLPITPVATLLLAAVLAATWNLARLRWKPLRAQVVTALALATIAWLWVRPGVVYVYDTVTPSTLQSMNHRLERHGVLDAGRLIVSEAGVVPARWRGGRRFDGKAAVLEVEDLTDAPAGLLRDSDAVIGTADGVERAAGAISQQGADRRTLRVSPGLGRLRGPPLVAKLAAWQPAGAPIQLELATCGKDCRSARVPASEHPGEVGSIVVWLKTRPFHEAVPPGLSLDGRELTLFPARVQPRARYYGTGRFSLGDQPLALRLEGGQFAGRIAVALHRWVPPDS